jgi:hypothetical protein
MCAIGIIGKDAKGEPNWVRLSRLEVDENGIFGEVQSVQNEMVIANTRIDQNEERIKLEAKQFDNCTPSSKDRIWGLFGEQDTLAHFEPLFLEHYSQSFHFPGGHTPTAEEVRTWYVPLAEKMLARFVSSKNLL